MNAAEGGRKVLMTILDKLGLPSEVTIEKCFEGECLQIHSEHGKYLIGRGGDRLDDLQYLVNRIVQKKLPDAPRLRVDCDSYRENQEQRLIDSVKPVAELVDQTGEPQVTKPFNAYHRRIIHNALKEMGYGTESQEGSGRYKKIIVKRS